MNLRIGVQVADALNVDNHELMVRALEREMRERLRRESNVSVLDEARVRVVFRVVAVDEVLEMIER